MDRILSQAEIDGLDRNCAVGMGGVFYTKTFASKRLVVTWLGDEVSREVEVKGNTLTFRRKGMVFRGRLHREADCFSFKRIR